MSILDGIDAPSPRQLACRCTICQLRTELGRVRLHVKSAVALVELQQSKGPLSELVATALDELDDALDPKAA